MKKNTDELPLSANETTQKKMQEEELILRAKKVLMIYLNMTEPEAHQFIIKQAMNLRRTKVAMAESILNTYEL